MIRKTAAFFVKYTCDDNNASIRSLKFHNELKQADIVLYIKRSQNYLKKIIDLLVFFQISPRFMKDTYMIKSQNSLIILFKVTVWFWKGLQRATLLFSYDREMEKNCG